MFYFVSVPDFLPSTIRSLFLGPELFHLSHYCYMPFLFKSKILSITQKRYTKDWANNVEPTLQCQAWNIHYYSNIIQQEE